MNYLSANQVSFQARCPQIRDAQKVCHVINEQLPHISSTKLRSAYFNLMDKGMDKSFNLRYIKWMRAFSDRFHEVRELYIVDAHGGRTTKPMRVLNQMKFEGMGNCFENGKAAEIIMKINGIKHARSAGLKRGNSAIDHFVCVFNRDGSVFDGTIKNNQTIIVDPWLGKVDFAGNMFKIYENTCKRLLKIPDKGKFGFRYVEDAKIDNDSKFLMKMYFPKLFYKK